MSGEAFDDLTDVYEAMIDWPKRLANESVFYRRLFDRIGARSVLDSACGTGRHAAMFHEWGFRVEGADLSPRMIERARVNFGEPPGLAWTVRGFDQPVDPPQPFDAAVCVGNSLALAPDKAAARRAVAELVRAVRAGGEVVVQVLNLWQFSDGPCVWQKCKRATLAGRDVLIVKGVHRCGTSGYVDLIVADAAKGTLLQSQSVAFLSLEAAELEQMAHEAGAQSIALFGGYRQQPYDRSTSPDLLMIATK